MLMLVVVLLSACGETFEERSESFAEAICSYGRKCLGRDNYSTCYQDVVNDMKDAETKLDEMGQEECMECMQVKIEELGEGCTPDEERLLDACGDDYDAACAGYP